MDRNDVEESIERRLARPVRKAPLKSNASTFKSLSKQHGKPKDLPPWLVFRDRVVMRWRGWHHVAKVGGDDPFEVAQALFKDLRERRHKRQI